MTPERLEEIREHVSYRASLGFGTGSLQVSADLLAYVDELRAEVASRPLMPSGHPDWGPDPTRRPRVYIAGPMTGHEDWNFPAFNAAADALREAGYEPVNPAEAFGGDVTRSHAEYMREACRQLATCQGILYLDGWRESKGAVFEASIAHVLGMEFYVRKEFPSDPGSPGTRPKRILRTFSEPRVVPVVVEPVTDGGRVTFVQGLNREPFGMFSPWLNEPAPRAKPPKVLILGYTGAGKTTVGGMLCDEFGCEGPANVGDAIREDWDTVSCGNEPTREALYHYGRAYECSDPTTWLREALLTSPIVTGHIPEDVLRACVKKGLFDAYVWVARPHHDQQDTDPMAWTAASSELRAAGIDLHIARNYGDLPQLSLWAENMRRHLAEKHWDGKRWTARGAAMRITIEDGPRRAIVEDSPVETAGQVLRRVCAAMVGFGFTAETVADAVCEMADVIGQERCEGDTL